MNGSTYLKRSLAHYWRAHLAVLLGVAAGCAALTGALLVGDSMRASLREFALGGLGRIDNALVANKPFGEDLPQRIAASPGFQQRFGTAAGVLVLRGSVTAADTQARTSGVSVIGANAGFAELFDSPDGANALDEFTGRSVIVNAALAHELRISEGDDVLIRVGKPSAISTETLLGRRDDTTAALRLTVERVLPSHGLGGFTLNPRQNRPLNAYVPRTVLQRALALRGRINAILVGRGGVSETADLQARLRSVMTAADAGLRIRTDVERAYVSVDAEAMLIDPPTERAVRAAAAEIGAPLAPVISYLANEIALEPRDGPSIPYSTVAGIDPNSFVFSSFAFEQPAPEKLARGEILLNEWAARRLDAKPGQRVRLRYYVAGSLGALRTRDASFTVKAIVKLNRAAADSGFVPEYPGVTDSGSIADWDPPFPIQLSKVGDADEAYWDKYRATPKAFVTLDDGRKLWAEREQRFGRLTSIRLRPPQGMSVAALAHTFEAKLLTKLDPQAVGLRFQGVRANAELASNGSTDFGGLFIGFSFFLIVSAAMLVALLFRLGIERRSVELGTLLAVGLNRRQAARLMIGEGCVVAALGSAVGLVAAAGYAWLMLAGLRTWWSAAANAPFLKLHVSATSLTIGFAASFLVAVGSIAWAFRGLTKMPARALLAGAVQSGRETRPAQRRRFAGFVAAASFVGAAAMVAAALAGAMPQAGAFFGSGSLALIGALAVVRAMLTREPHSAIGVASAASLTRLGFRNARRQSGRSMLTIALIASATFLIVALAAFRLDADPDALDPHSGTGGFSLYGEADAPLPYDLNTADGRDKLNMLPADSAELARTATYPLRLRDGDASSCLNLYTKTRPRILGAPQAFIARGGFRFSQVLEPVDNPWKLLQQTLPDGAIPVIGDEAAVLWQLHLALGKDLELRDQRGRDVKLRFVALLSNSALQDELIVSEQNFERLFPSISGYGFFLFQTPRGDATRVSNALERGLTNYGFDAAGTVARINDYLAVQNTYLSTFQTLGGLGLILGAVGLIAVMLRNVFERRSELALMRALGFSRNVIGKVVISEIVLLVVTGLACGVIPALIAIAPAAAARPAAIPWLSIGTTLIAVLAVGIGVAAPVLRASLRAPLLAALRSE